MILIVGLGNPGKKYEKTRHNIGFGVVDAFLQELMPVKKTEWKFDKKSNSEFVILNSKFILAKPQTMMNASGHAVKKLLSYLAIEQLSDLWVVYDDLDLPLGKIKIRKGGGTAGHRGIDSVVKELGTPDFVRFRLGIGHPRQKSKGHLGGQAGFGSSNQEVERYVLSPFKPGEKVEARRMVNQAVEAIKLALDEGLEKAMNRFN